MKNTICLDLGTVHTGIAISHEGLLAEPLTTVFESKRGDLLGKLLPIIARYDPDKIIIGIPDRGPLVKEAVTLKTEIEKIFSGEVILFPEDYSSRSAKKVLKEVGKNLEKRKSAEHQTAAALILQDYLDNINI